jgi:hypothetical protein
MNVEVGSYGIYGLLLFNSLMEKPTKRMAFNFLRSYFDVLNELDKDEDKLSFLMAIINKSFLDEDPKELNFIVKLCYQSQKHAIEKSVKGWLSANNTDLQGNPIPQPPPSGLPSGSPYPLPSGSPAGQEEEEGQEEEKEKQITKDQFLKLWNETRTAVLNKASHVNHISTDVITDLNVILKAYTEEQIKTALKGLFKQENFPNGNTVMQSSVRHFIKFFENYLTAGTDMNAKLYGKTKTV